MQAPALKENFDTPETSIFDELVEREQFQVRFPGENSHICALFQLWLDGTYRWSLLQLEGRPGQGMLGLSCAWVFSATGWNLYLRSAAVSRVPRSTLRQGMRLSGTWVFFQGLEPHVICKAYAAHNNVTYSMKSTLGCICICKSYNNV
jgi:hypothetical protein